ncbi:MAG TPA: Imm21 family immunity protein [Gemmatimonadaceae bacterium]|nr:Imm21 family immunity protein [Gemmatimonadaceae bacterium]
MTHLPGLLRRRGALQWLDTDAGAVIALPRSLEAEWSGIEPPRGRVIPPDQATCRMEPAQPATDYDRVCSIPDGVALLPLGEHRVLVVGGVPLPTAWQADPDGGGVFVQLFTSETGDLPDALPAFPASLSWEEVGTFDAPDDTLVMMDSTDVGRDPPLYPRVTIAIAPGRYRVAYAHFAHPDMQLELVRILPAT